MNPSLYDKNLLAKSLVLAEVRNAPGITGAQLSERLEVSCVAARAKYPTFDFVHWAGAPIWEVLEFFSAAGFISSKSAGRDTPEWKTSPVHITPKGERFLTSAIMEMPFRVTELDEPHRLSAVG